MKSMTGYGRSSLANSTVQIDVTARAVNGRFLDVRFSGPKAYAGLESDLKKLASQYILRGTLDLSVSRKTLGGSEDVNFNRSLAKKWLKGFNRMAQDLGLEPATSSQVLLEVPELIQVKEPDKFSAAEKKLVLTAVKKALEDCSQVRKSEGKALLKDIGKHLQALGACLKKIQKLREKTLKDLKKRYQERLKQLDVNVEIDEQRLAHEVVLIVDKSDINEEVQRLGAHLKAIDDLTKSKGSLGKKLDFYAQELLREVNTIGSKSTSSELTQVVVDAKGFIEKYREQVQNVE